MAVMKFNELFRAVAASISHCSLVIQFLRPQQKRKDYSDEDGVSGWISELRCALN